MKAVLDTCVIYPTVMREMLLGAARLGHFTPIWSARILEEWARAARKLGPTGEAQARAEIALTQANWPDAERAPNEGLQNRLWLPDAADIHVLATAIAASADVIVTVNAKDFPRNILAEEGLDRVDPDSLLHGFWQADATGMNALAAQVLAEANRLSGVQWTLRALMKKARFPRLGKALTT
ncbi:MULTISPECIES: RSP_2648 family PIN domain-containing protein [unclassified Ruegeria]|uniref:RSP_2648 family PIN domain-containing protein n=1 Tax=unclassified Ruegeria TaxID=2625375 RepID=UPI001492C3A1|nr:MULTISPECIES: PIN domain-containing protein [unclassified Ruegeria]NOD87687.1 PIN domain-containing protein [Ruegeria sp. HKCCD4318]NOE14057.1 PIN domain-containing protein [Ruegeria sp. HKCCD4318-2]NOG08586.1 PIN domain-containing protein [Ruegeria sp. HKCCD4315]